MSTFADYIEKERARLGKLIEDYNAQIAELQGKLTDAQKEMQAIDAYEQVKQGKAPAPRATPTTPRTPRATGTRSPRGAKREELLAILQETPNLTRGEIIEKLGIKGNKQQEQSISNALANMKKAGTITADDGKYAVV
jgi:hypothetical protein